jgi:hypothetical protein
MRRLAAEKTQTGLSAGANFARSGRRAQTLDEGLQAGLLETLKRYETHLDCKFERTLAMLLKLKQLRSG